jgi:hypothetical protein
MLAGGWRRDPPCVALAACRLSAGDFVTWHAQVRRMGSPMLAQAATQQLADPDYRCSVATHRQHLQRSAGLHVSAGHHPGSANSVDGSTLLTRPNVANVVTMSAKLHDGAAAP